MANAWITVTVESVDSAISNLTMSIVNTLLVTVLTCLLLANAANIGGNSENDLKTTSINSKEEHHNESGHHEEKDFNHNLMKKISSTYTIMIPFAILSAFLLFMVVLSLFMLKSKSRNAKKVDEGKTVRAPLMKKDLFNKGKGAHNRHNQDNLYMISESDEELSVDNNTLLRLAEGSSDSEDDELVVAVDGVFSI